MQFRQFILLLPFISISFLQTIFKVNKTNINFNYQLIDLKYYL